MLQPAEFLPPAVVRLRGDPYFLADLRCSLPVRDLHFNLEATSRAAPPCTFSHANIFASDSESLLIFWCACRQAK
jgi:hypothetical protein